MKAVRRLFYQWIYEPIAGTIRRYRLNRVPLRFVWKEYLLYAAVVIVGGTLLFILEETIRLGNTGFRTKSLWDWMELLVIPFVLALGAFILNRSEKNIERQNLEERARLEREISTDRQQEAALQAYLDRMADLLLKEKLLTTENEEVRNVARIRTLTVLRGLDATRKGLVVRFLYEANLITKESTIVDLIGADLSAADLSHVGMRNVNLRDVNLNKANLSEIDLQNADLRGAYLNNADLSGAVLFNTDLREARLSEAYLQGSKISSADLSDSNLSRINLTNSKISDTNLAGANLRGGNLSGLDLSNNVDLRNTLLNSANLSNANLSNARLEHAFLRDANLSGAKLQFADLNHADLLDANLSGADLRHSNLSNADLRWVILRSADLLGAKVNSEQLTSARSPQGAIMPDGTIHE